MENTGSTIQITGRTSVHYHNIDINSSYDQEATVGINKIDLIIQKLNEIKKEYPDAIIREIKAETDNIPNFPKDENHFKELGKLPSLNIHISITKRVVHKLTYLK